MRMASPATHHHPLALPASVPDSADRRFPFTDGGGRAVNPNDPERKYRIPHCYHGWPAQARKSTYNNVREDIWGCRGYIWGNRLDDGFHCGYKESGDVSLQCASRHGSAWLTMH